MLIKKIVTFFLIVPVLTSCFLEPKKISESKSGSSSVNFTGKVTPSSIGSKNFLQINNTYSSITGISTIRTNTEYEKLKTQLPSTSNPASLNGFNQIASTRLAFLYCDPYIDENSDVLSLSIEDLSVKLINSFIDADVENNKEHQSLYENVLAVLNDEDELISESDEDIKKIKVAKLACTAILASSYVTLL